MFPGWGYDPQFCTNLVIAGKEFAMCNTAKKSAIVLSFLFAALLLAVPFVSFAAEEENCTSRIATTSTDISVITSVTTEAAADSSGLSRELLRAAKDCAKNGKTVYSEPVENLAAFEERFGIK